LTGYILTVKSGVMMKRGKLTDALPEEHLNSFDEIPNLMRKLLKKRIATP
jgi:hypothetical protein